MSSKAEKERLKQIQDKCQNLLMQMLKDDDNKYCVDCDAKGPRWASWNIGIFLCIRCAGIHRNLGVHISRVKSVNLDTWTPEQVVSLQQMGNSRARAVYEANIPDNFRRPQTDSTLEAFIRAKYEQKKYIASEWVPPALPKINWDKEFEEEAEIARRKKKDPKGSSSATPVRPPLSSVPVPALLPKPMASSPKISRNKNGILAGSGVGKSNANVCFTAADLLELDISPRKPVHSHPPSSGNNSSSSLDSEFNSFLSAPVTCPPSATNPQVASSNPGVGNENLRSAEEDNFFNQPTPNSQTKKQLTTDSILALYGKSTPTLPNQIPAMPQAMFTPQGMQPNMGAFPSAQAAFGSPFAPRPANMPNIGPPNQTMLFPTDNAMFPPNQYMANPFYNMAAQQPSSLPQTNGQQFQFSTPVVDSKKVLNGNGFNLDLGNFNSAPANSSLHIQMGNLNMAGSSVPLVSQHPMGAPAQPFQAQFNPTPNQPTQPLNPVGQTLSNNLWQ